MKLIIIIMTTCLMQVSAASFAQKLTYSKKGATLEQIFTEIRKQTGYFVVFAENKVDKTAKLDVNFRNTELKNVLEVISNSQDLTYTFDDKNISLKPKESSFLNDVIARFQAIDVRGKVVDSLGNGLAGATVSVKGTKNSTSTAANGDFYLKNVDEDVMLVVSYMGYITKEIKVDKDFNYVRLQQSTSKLDEVQVIAYGTTTQRYNTGNVTTIKSDVIERVPVTNPLIALQGLVPGLEIIQGSGVPGSSVTVKIRGRNSINNGSDPLYIVDGVPYPAATLQGNGDFITGATTSPLNYLNMASIESIDVLKDADATAIYGSRGANGVILISTKTGKAGKMEFTLDASEGYTQMRNRVKMLNTSQYLALRREGFKNDGIIPSANILDLGYAPDLMLWDTTRFTDWEEVFRGREASYSNYQLNLNGGGSNIKYVLGVNYNKNSSVFNNDIVSSAAKKVGLNFSMSIKSPDQRFSAIFSGNYQNERNHQPSSDTYLQAMLPPNAPEVFLDNGQLNWENNTWVNPLAAMFNTLTQNTRNLVASVNLGYNILPGLNFNTNTGYTNLDVNDVLKFPLAGVNPAYRSTWERTAKYAFNRIQTWIAEPQLTYGVGGGNLDLNFLIGGSVQQSSTNNVLLGGSGYISDALLESVQAANDIVTGGASLLQYRYIAGFSRVNLNYAKKYLLNLNFRRDGTTRFGPEKRFANFFSVGAGWIISEEKVFKSLLPFVSFSKLRGSYGTTGNDQIPDYSYLNLYEPFGNYQEGRGLTVNRPYNPALRWETNQKLEIGLELGFLKDRLLFTASYYRNRPSDQLVDFALTEVTGFNAVRINWDAVIQNQGLELVASTQVINSSLWKWQLNANISFQNNKLLKYPGLEDSQFKDLYKIGESINSARLYRYSGVNPETGLYQFYDRNNVLTSNPTYLDQRKVSVETDYFGGITNTISYRGFGLNFLIDFSKFSTVYAPDVYPGAPNNFPAYVEDRWRKPGDKAMYQRAFVNFGDPYFTQQFYNNSDAAYLNTYWVKLRNVGLSYALPPDFCNKLQISGLQLNILAHNIFTVSDFPGPDPEMRSSFNTPTVFRVTGGMKLTF